MKIPLLTVCAFGFFAIFLVLIKLNPIERKENSSPPLDTSTYSTVNMNDISSAPKTNDNQVISVSEKELADGEELLKENSMEDDVLEMNHEDSNLADLLSSYARNQGAFSKDYEKLIPLVISSQNLEVRREFYELLTGVIFGIYGKTDLDALGRNIETLLAHEFDGDAFSRLLLRYQVIMSDESRVKKTADLIANSSADISDFDRNELRAVSLSSKTSATELNSIFDQISLVGMDPKLGVASTLMNRLYFWALDNPDDIDSIQTKASSFLQEISSTIDGVSSYDEHQIDPAFWIRTNGLIEGDKALEKNELRLFNTTEASNTKSLVASVLMSIKNDCERGADTQFLREKCGWYRESKILSDKVSNWMNETAHGSQLFTQLRTVHSYFYK